MVRTDRIHATFEQMSKQLEVVNKYIEEMLPHAIIRKTSSFGNSSHIVLSKDLINKKVGVIVLDTDKNSPKNYKGGKK